MATATLGLALAPCEWCGQSTRFRTRGGRVFCSLQHEVEHARGQRRQHNGGTIASRL